MSLLLGMMAASILQAAPTPLPAQGWVWTLYENGGSVVVLAEEVPDTPHLRSTFECAPNSNQIKLTRYQPGKAVTGPAQLSAGSAQQEAEMTVEGERLTLSLQAGSNLFRSLVASGRVSLSYEGGATDIRFDRNGLAQLRRFAETCTG